MRDNIFIRTDSSTSIGLGHVIRCIALARMLRSHFKITFVCRSIPQNIVSALLTDGLQVEIINDDAIFLSWLHKEDIIVLDGYEFDIFFHNSIKAKGCLLVCIDDLHDQNFAADLVINHAPGIVKENYRAPFYTQFALGLDYVLLRQPFLLSARKKREEEKRKETNDTVMICFGGSDPLNITEKALTIVRKFTQLKKIIVVTGEFYRHIHTLSEHSRHDERVELQHNLSDVEMAAVMMGSDIAIVQSSGTLFESLACGCIAVTGIYIDNQKFVYHNFVNSNAVYGAEDFSELPLSKALALAINDTHNTRAPLIDGYSDERMQKIFRQLALSAGIQVHRATQSEVDVTYKWATDQRIRNFSFNRHQISYEEHTVWLQSKLDDSCCVYLIAKLDSDTVGSIRFDYKENTHVISYLIDPAFQGKGLGQVLLLAGIQYMIKNSSATPVCFTGYVVENNIPSLKAFRKLGFSESKDNGHYKFELKL